jgi:ABC-type transporter Mla subunit MlaD
MKRIATFLLLGLGLPALVVFGMGAGEEDGSGYQVRAIFDNAAYIVKGEDVKIAGAVVGSVKSLDVTDDKKAAIVIEIKEPGFAPFREGASCTVRPQSLIGEKFVECTIGPDSAPELKKIEDGDGEGQALLTETSSPVDIDLVNNSLRMPFRQRLALIINEFGTGLAGRGAELNEAIHRANPALRETSKVLNILSEQNQTLADLARDSDTVLQPLADRRERVASFINNANQTAEATAERSADLERNFELLPSYLRELRPILTSLDAFATEFTPVLADAETAAPDLVRFNRELGPFSEASIPALASLGDALDVGRPALEASRPLLRELIGFADNAGPVSKQLDDLTKSLDETGAIEYAMDYIFFQMTAVNGFDGISHYLRAGLITNLCQSYSIERVTGCSANFRTTDAIPPGGGSSQKRDESLTKLQETLAKYMRLFDTSTGKPVASKDKDPKYSAEEARNLLMDPDSAKARDRALDGRRSDLEKGDEPVDNTPEARLLDYMLGDDR